MSKHILTVVVDPTCEFCASANPDDWCSVVLGQPVQCSSWNVTCPGLTENCLIWWECMDCNRSDEARDDLDDEPVRHGVEHRSFSFGWGTPGKTCLYLSASVADAIGDMGPEPGAYEISVDWSDDLPDVGLTPVADPAPVAT